METTNNQTEDTNTSNVVTLASESVAALRNHLEGAEVGPPLEVNGRNIVQNRTSVLESVITMPESSPRQINLRRIAQLEDKFETGYDSDDALGPFTDAIEVEGEQVFEENSIPLMTELPPPPLPNINDEQAGDGEGLDGQFIPIDEATLLALKVEGLKDELKIRGEPVYGKKEVLLSRLRDALSAKKGVFTPAELLEKAKKKKKKPQPTNKKDSVGKGFPPTAYWRDLVPNANTVEEPQNPHFEKPRAPTISEADAEFVPPKHNFNEAFDVPTFGGIYHKPKFTRQGNLKKDNRRGPKGGNVVTENWCIPDDGVVQTSFMLKHKLTPTTSPTAYMEVFVPTRKNMPGGFNTKEFISIEQWTKFTNLKAHLAGAGDTQYKDFKPFSIAELKQHIGVYFLQGIAPVPQVEFKFKPQRQDWAHGNDFVFNSFGPSAARRHRHFKCFFSIQNPAIETPSKLTMPNWKVKPFLDWMNYFYPMAWSLGGPFSVDEMTMGFQGRHQDKKRITYKAEGDGFQADALCQCGFTYQIHMRNDPAPKKYLDQGLSPLHSRVMALFDSVVSPHHQCFMDNLYNSASFCRAAYNHPKKVLTSGVARKGSRGVPESVVQVEVTSRSAQIGVRGTVKAAVLEGDPGCPHLLASSVYDAKPVHYLSMMSTNIEWIVKTRQVFSYATGQQEDLQFLRLKHIDEYNTNMGDVDLADQLRGAYRFDRWVRNRKWWWSLFFWQMGVSMTNAYVCYNKVCDCYGIERKHRTSHFDFQKSIAENWIGKFSSKRNKPNDNNPRGRAPPIESTNRFRPYPMSSPILSPLTTDSRTSQSIQSSASGSTTTRPSKCARLTDDSLSPTGGLKMRLDTTINHLPIKSRTRSRCALHSWASERKQQTEAFVMYCPTCNVNLCIDCYNFFHLTADIHRHRQSIINGRVS